MELIIKKTIGKTVYPFTFTGNTLHEVVMESQNLSFPDIHRCGICGSDDLSLTAHVTKEEQFQYTQVKCGKCRGELTFGQKKKNPNMFYFRKDDNGNYDWKAFQPETTETTAPAGPKSAPPVQDPPKQQAEQRQAQKPPAAKPNDTAKTHRNAKRVADEKPSGKAINYAMKIAAVGTDAALKDLGLLIKQDAVINKSETDIKYLQTEYLKKFHLLTNPQAVAEQKEYAQLQA